MTKQSADLIFAILTLACWVFLVCIVAVALLALVSDVYKQILSRIRDLLEGQTLALAWIVALVATTGSLMYSETFHLVPCRYCWFQRIGIYPLAIILGIAVFTHDRGVRKYVLGLNIPTILVSTWHVLIQHVPGLEPPSASCDPLNPCTQILVNQFGVITIPVMALTTSVTIATLMLLTRRAGEELPEEADEEADEDADDEVDTDEVEERVPV